MVTKLLTIKNEKGLHLRSAAALASICRPFDAQVALIFNQNEYNLKSVLGIVGAGVRHGDTVEVSCNGSDQEQAMQAIEEAINKGL